AGQRGPAPSPPRRSIRPSLPIRQLNVWLPVTRWWCLARDVSCYPPGRVHLPGRESQEGIFPTCPWAGNWMLAVWWRVRAGLRRDWRGLAVLALVTALMGSAVLVTLAGA